MRKRLHMLTHAYMLTTVAFSVMATPIAARAQATAAFDGSYSGVSAALSGAMGSASRSCPNFAAPAPLTIASGHARVKWGDDTLQGDVTPQGALTMRLGSGGGRLDGQIDAQGALRGSYSGYCAYALVWQRRH
jgi:hypothetical protein